MEIPEFKFIPSSVSVYLYYAGRNRKYMTVSRVDEAVFLDIPGFLTDENTFLDDQNIIRSLNRSADVRRNLRSPENYQAATGLANYNNVVPQIDGRVDRSFSADFGNVRTLFVEMKAGDIVIMTPEAHYDKLLIGEIKSEWNAEQTMTLPDQGANPLPYREVNWLAHSLTRRDFPARVARRMQNRKAISRFDPGLYDEIFKYVYPRYIWGNTSKLDVFAPNYSSADPTVTLESSFLIKYAAAAYAAIQKGEIDRFHSLPLEQAANEYFDPALVIQIAQAFGSPGGYLAKLIGTGAAITIAALLSLALSDESQTADQAKHAAAERIEQIRHDAPPNSGVNWDGIHRSVTVGNVDELRTRYGREARSKLGLTLHGDLPPQLTAVDGARQHDQP